MNTLRSDLLEAGNVIAKLREDIEAMTETKGRVALHKKGYLYNDYNSLPAVSPESLYILLEQKGLNSALMEDFMTGEDFRVTSLFYNNENVYVELWSAAEEESIVEKLSVLPDHCIIDIARYVYTLSKKKSEVLN